MAQLTLTFTTRKRTESGMKADCSLIIGLICRYTDDCHIKRLQNGVMIIKVRNYYRKGCYCILATILNSIENNALLKSIRLTSANID